MTHNRPSSRRWSGIRWLSAMIALCVLLPTASAQGLSGKSSGKLSMRLAQFKSPSLITRSKTEIAQDLSLPASGAGSLQFNTSGAVLASIRVSDVSASTQAALATAGASVRHVSERYGVIDAYVPTGSLDAVAAVGAVEYVGEALRPLVRGAQPHQANMAARPAATAATCPTGVVSEGDTQLKAAQARSTYSVSGSGVTVGVLSDSYNTDSTAVTRAPADIAAGDLPGASNPCGHTTPVSVLDDTVSGYDEGRAMLQIIHDLAPDAKLAFSTVGGSMYEMADNIRALGNAGADIVTDDVVFYGEPFFQDGPVNVAIRENAAKGIPHFTAAGNANVTDGAGHNITSYEASAYRPIACPDFKMPDGSSVPASIKPKDCHNFSASGQDATSTFTLSSGNLTMEFQWAEPWFGVSTDLDIFLINNATNQIVAVSNYTNTEANEVTGTQAPLELMAFSGTGNYSLIIGRYSGSGTPRLKYVLQSADGISSTEYNASTNSVDSFGPSVGDHVAVSEGIGVGAVPYNNSSTPENFTSLGPATHYFGPLTYDAGASDGVKVQRTPAAALASPQVLSKPDFAATDGGATSFFAQQVSGVWRFYGTSAAAPHAAGVAALAAEYAAKHNITIGASYVESILEQGASPIANGTEADTGAGLVNAVASLGLIKDLDPQIYLPLATR